MDSSPEGRLNHQVWVTTVKYSCAVMLVTSCCTATLVILGANGDWCYYHTIESDMLVERYQNIVVQTGVGEPNLRCLVLNTVDT